MLRVIRTGMGRKFLDCNSWKRSDADSEVHVHCINVFEFDLQVDEVFLIYMKNSGTMLLR